MRANSEDRWHRKPRRGEQVPYPADSAGPGCFCMDAKHGTPGTLVTTSRHGTGKRWQARWVDHDGNELSLSFDRRADAQRQVTSVTTDLTTGTYADPRRSAITFGETAKQWLASKSTLKPKTVGGYQGLLDTVILPKWETVSLRDIDHAGLQAWITWLATDKEARQRGRGDGLSPARVIQAHQVVHQVLGFALRSKFIAANPADGILLPRKNAAEKQALSHAQVRTLTDECDDDIKTMVLMLAYAGLRFGEAIALRVRDVDIARRRLHVSRSITQVRGKGWVEGPTKTHQARSVPILTQPLTDALEEAVRDRDPGEFVFLGTDPTRAMTVGWFRSRFDRAVRKAGLTDVTPHTLRHTAGSLALALGTPVVTVSKLLGHRNVTTTMNVYAHLMADDFDNLAAAMDKAVSLSK
jgi:integrase